MDEQKAHGPISLDEGLAHALRQIARTRPDRSGWIAPPRDIGLNAIVTLRSLDLIETLSPFPKPGDGGPAALVKVTAHGVRALIGSPVRAP